MKLTIDKASIIVDGALAYARANKIRPLCVAVLDDGGHVKALKRDDGASMMRPTIAISKAWGAIGMGESSRHLGERLKNNPAFLGALSDMSGGKVVPVAGGVLILEGDAIVGAAGASGASADEDEAAVVAGIKAAGLEYKI
ncbi:MAG TPA: heme-binding protein [Candidatus Binatia bacterium]|jgi:uncharacterized protein GlcG (DUF336 family)